MAIAIAFVLGACGWTAAEYLLHRFVGHGRFERARRRFWWASVRLPFLLFHEEHVAHHRDPLYFAPGWKKALAAGLLVPTFGGLASLVAGPVAGFAWGAGFAGTYVAYEVLHRRIHTHAPLNAWFAWMRRHHLHHHVAPRLNHGVTSPAWDVVFGTRVSPTPVKLPRALAPAWLVEPATGAIRREFSGEYELVGR